MIDIGCGTKPYEDLVRPFVESHVGVDHPVSLHSRSKVDLSGTAYSIPTEDASFDSALCTAVLEHLEEPEAALRECNRVLVPGGYAVYTVPFIWHIHEEPRDFYRFTRFGLAHLFGKAGFVDVEVRALSGFAVTFGQLLVYRLQSLNKGVVRRLGIVTAVGLLIQGFAYVAGRFDKSERWTWMYLVSARKPGTAPAASGLPG